MRDTDYKEIILISSFLNVCVLLFLMMMLYSFTEAEYDEDIQLNFSYEEIEEEKLDIIASNDVVVYDDFVEQRDSAMEGIFLEALIGKYRITNKVEFNFGLNGLYSGFFDNSNQNVSGYRYEIVVLNDTPFLNIYNKEETAMVSYELHLSKTSEVILYYPGTGLEINLKK